MGISSVMMWLGGCGDLLKKPSAYTKANEDASELGDMATFFSVPWTTFVGPDYRYMEIS